MNFTNILAKKIGRVELSKKYIKGKGLEIGGLHQPLQVDKDVQVIYVDKFDRKTAYTTQYVGLKNEKLVNVDVIDDGEKLLSIPEESQDFIIANHFLEHTQNPIQTTKTHISRIRNGGILYYTVPDKRKTFDKKRPLTTFEHVKNDFENGPEHSYDSHLAEWVKLVSNIPDSERQNRIDTIKKIKHPIHFHVWDANSFRYFLNETNKLLGNPYEILEFVETQRNENIAILRRIKPNVYDLPKSENFSDKSQAIDVLMKVYQNRADLQSKFPEAKNGDLKRIIAWAIRFGIKKDRQLKKFASYFASLKSG